MWAKKSEVEYQKDQTKRFWLRFLCFSLLICLLSIFLCKTGSFKYHRASPKTWGEVFEMFPFLIGFSMVVSSFVAYFYGKRSGAWICSKCDKLRKSKNQKFCECGEEFISINRLNWVKENK